MALIHHMKISIEALGKSSAAAAGTEVWLVRVTDRNGDIRLAGLETSLDGGYTIREERTLDLGPALFAVGPANVDFDAPDGDVRLSFLTHQRGGLVSISAGAHRRRVNLFNYGSPRILEVLCSANSIKTSEDPRDDELNGADGNSIAAIAVPKWRGVFTATHKIFRHVLPCPRDINAAPSEITEQEVGDVVERILRSPIRCWFVSGGDIELLQIVRRTRDKDPDKRFYLLFHGAFLSLGMTLDRKIFIAWIEAARQGDIDGILTVKRGMDRLCRALGVRSAFLPLHYPEMRKPRGGARRAADGAPKDLGVWLSRGDDPRKACPALPYALRGIEGVVFNGSGINWDVATLVRRMEIPIGYLSSDPIPQRQLADIMGRMALNIYITASECSPMIPLESLALGVPCLMGPVTYYFDDDDYLHDRLIVPDITDPLMIRAHILRALSECDEIMDAYAAYQAKHVGETDRVLEKFVFGKMAWSL